MSDEDGHTTVQVARGCVLVYYRHSYRESVIVARNLSWLRRRRGNRKPVSHSQLRRPRTALHTHDDNERLRNDKARRSRDLGRNVRREVLDRSPPRPRGLRSRTPLASPLTKLAAVKILASTQKHPALKSVVATKFTQEAHTLSLLRHPNIVHFLDFDDQAPTPYLAMDFIPGGRTLGRGPPAKGTAVPCRSRSPRREPDSARAGRDP